MTLFHLFLVNFREETSLSTYPFTMYKHTYMHTAHTFSSHTKKKKGLFSPLDYYYGTSITN